MYTFYVTTSIETHLVLTGCFYVGCQFETAQVWELPFSFINYYLDLLLYLLLEQHLALG